MNKWLAMGCVIVSLGCEDTRGESDASVVDAGSRDAGSAGGDAAIDAGTAEDAGMMGDAGTSGGETCELALDVTAGGTFGGTTVGTTDDYSVAGTNCPSGGTASGGDIAYVVSPTAATRYRITVTPLDGVFDPMLYAMFDCAGNVCQAGTVLNVEGEPEEITLDVLAGERIYVVVDGEVFTHGPYQLAVVIE